MGIFGPSIHEKAQYIETEVTVQTPYGMVRQRGLLPANGPAGMTIVAAVQAVLQDSRVGFRHQLAVETQRNPVLLPAPDKERT